MSTSPTATGNLSAMARLVRLIESWPEPDEREPLAITAPAPQPHRRREPMPNEFQDHRKRGSTRRTREVTEPPRVIATG